MSEILSDFGCCTFQHWDQLCNGRHPAGSKILSEGHLEQEHGDPAEDHGDEVDDEEDSAAVFVAQVREPPHVPQPDGHGDAGEEEVPLVFPRPALRFLLFVFRLLLPDLHAHDFGVGDRGGLYQLVVGILCAVRHLIQVICSWSFGKISPCFIWSYSLFLE